MKLVIDYREKKLIQLVNSVKLMNGKYNPIHVEIENLPLSDIIIKDKNDVELLMIERKTINDLASSIQDGRYKEQSYRLSHCNIHNHNIIYLIEGDISMWNNRYTKISRETIYSAIVSMMYYKGFSIFRTTTLVETAEFLLQMALKIGKSKPKKPYFENVLLNTSIESTQLKPIEGTTSSEEAPSKMNITLNSSVVETLNTSVDSNPSLRYSKYVKREKKSNITPENIEVIMLSQIPHVSVDTSMQIIEIYKSVYNLINSITEDSNCLNGLMIKGKSGGKRKLSSKTIQNIRNFLILK